MTQKHPLSVIQVEKQTENKQLFPLKKSTREETQARFERLWHLNPHQFNPLRSCVERERLKRTMQLLGKHLSIKDKKVVDLGCGSGTLAMNLNHEGAFVDAVDAATLALTQLSQHRLKNITTIQDCLPTTLLKDEAYDLVLCTEVIGYIAERDHRLFFNELARLVKKEGYVVCSTPIDIYSEDALEKFITLAKTELDLLDYTLSYHRLYISLRNILEAPQSFQKGCKDLGYREERLAQYGSFGKFWYKMNSHPLLYPFWKLIGYATRPLSNFVKQSHITMVILERLSKILFSDSGISHIIFISKRRPMLPVQNEVFPVYERKQKKSVWE